MTVVDGFAGGGHYRTDGGEYLEGSPVIILKAIKAAREFINIDREKERALDVDFYFNDFDRNCIEYLRDLINLYAGSGEIDLPDALKVNYSAENFASFATNRISRFASINQNGRYIFILDQYNYMDIPFGLIKNIFQLLPKAEVILTFNVGALTTFLSDCPSSRKPMQEIGLDKYLPWDLLQSLREHDKKEWRTLIQACLAQGMQQESRVSYMTPFFVRPNNSSPWDYWLVHLSNHYRAHDVMKKLHWLHGNKFGHQLSPGYFTYGYSAKDGHLATGANLFEFNNREYCVAGIAEHIDKKLYELGEPIAVGKLLQDTIVNSAGDESHFQDSFQLLHQEKQIVIVGANGKKRRVSKRYHLTDIVRSVPRQLRLDFGDKKVI
ncbi:three-Cys-motif partner protein TcmP [Deltaproteobacteria bacterium OttesenSCG-928-K17]|nr:three-Cys-motif partner protein TcmP [Deltaproteobacteria bacterium OttesenSCG-928-K17]